MIATNPEFIKADNFTFKKYLAAVLNGKQLIYSSVWNWWKKTTAFWCIPLLLGDVALFIAIVYQEWKEGSGFDWPLVFSLLMVVFVCFLPFVWAVTYYYSFVSPQKIVDKFMTLIDTYIPDAEQIKGLSYTNYIVSWREYEYELAYSLIPMVNKKGKVVAHYPCMIVCLHFIPSHEHESEVMDEQGQYLESFLDKCYAYCEGKESCRTLRIENNSMYAFFRIRDLKDKQLIMNSMEQMQYIVKRFNLVPLYLNRTLETAILCWLQINDNSSAKGIVAFNIGIFETEESYALHLTGSKTYDPDDDDWACNEDFKADEKYLELPKSEFSEQDWQDFQSLVKVMVDKYLELHAQNEKSIFYHKIVTIGFDEGDLVVVSKG